MTASGWEQVSGGIKAVGKFFHGTGYFTPGEAATFRDDFTGEAASLDTASWDSVNCVGAGTAFSCSTSAGTTASHGGWVRGTSGGSNGDATAIFGELWWKPSRATNASPLVFETRISLPSVDLMGVGVGLTDARTEAAIPVSISATTWTTTPTNGVFMVYDSSATTPLFRGIGVKADVDTAAVDGTLPVVSTAITLKIEISAAGTATFYQDGTSIGSAANATTATTALCPMVAVHTRTAAAKSVDVDYVFVGCAR